MTESEVDRRPSPELVGGVVFMLGCIPAVAVAKALKDGLRPGDPAGGIAKFAINLMGAWGKWPSFLMGAGVAFVGAAIVIGVVERERLRRVISVVVASFGLSALMAALTPGAGGALGEATGGRLAVGLGAWTGALAGLLIIGAALWLGWLQGNLAFAKIELPAMRLPKMRWPSLPKREPRVPAPSQRGVKKPRPAPEPTRIAEGLTRRTEDGVSAAEANMLAPDAKTLQYMEEIWRRASQGLTQTNPIPPSPYPKDPRLEGRIPPGTQPLHPEGGAARARGAAGSRKGSRLPRTTEAEDPFSWVPGVRPDELDAPDLEAAEREEAEARARAEALRRESAAIKPPSLYPPGVRPLGEPRHDPRFAPGPGGRDGVEPLNPGHRPRPTWEAEADDDSEDDVVAPFPVRAVDARASTTDELVGAAEVVDAVEFPTVEAFLAASNDEEADDTDESDDTEVQAATDDDDSGWIDDEDEEDEDEDEEEDEDEDEDEEEDEDEDEDEESDDEEEAAYEEVEVEDEAVVEVEVAEVASAEDEVPEPTDDDDVVAVGDAAAYANDGLAYEAVDDDLDEPSVTLTPAPKKGRARRAEVVPSKPPAPTPAPRKQPSTSTTAKQGATVASKSPPIDLSSNTTLHRAGDLFVQEGRVAVSLLQRQLGLGFDEACGVLDSLQEVGLIGPYEGGQKREILLSAEEWAERCTTV